MRVAAVVLVMILLALPAEGKQDKTVDLAPAVQPGVSEPGASPPLQGREEKLYYFAAEGPGAYGMPGTFDEGYDFELMEPAGWFAALPCVDNVHWHVADVSLVAGHATDMSEALPFDPGDPENSYALWCGNPFFPGYGNYWSEAVEVAVGLAVTTSVQITFAYCGDFEGQDWDYFTVEALGSGDWFEIYRNDITGEQVYQVIQLEVSAATLGGALQAVRFQFRSDGGWSDQDGNFLTDIGAVWLDNVAIDVDSSPVVTEDFEDGQVPPAFVFLPIHDWADEIYTDLHVDVEISDPCWDESHTAWSFFDPDTPTEDYPDGVIPYGPPYAYLALESPVLEVDQTGAPMNYHFGEAESFELHLDGFFHMPMMDALVILQYEVRGRAAETGMFGPWECECGVIEFPFPICLTPTAHNLEYIAFESAGGLDLTLTGLQVRILMTDMCPYWCDLFGDGYPHAVGALIDRIRIVADMGETTVEESPALLLTRLHPAYPNPFNPRTEISFELAEEGETSLTVHDVAGRLVRTLVKGHLRAGTHVESWDGSDDSGQALPSGVYFLRLETRSELASHKVVLIQ